MTCQQIFLLICLTLLSSVCAVRQRFETMARLAFEHGVRVNELAACDVPKAQLIYFKDPNKVSLLDYLVKTVIFLLFNRAQIHQGFKSLLIVSFLSKHFLSIFHP